MKKIISVIVISLLLLTSVVFEQVFVHNTLDSLLEKIDVLENEIFDTENINSQKNIDFCIKIDDFWTKKEKILCLSINHNDLNSIGEQIKKVIICTQQNKKDECVYELNILKFYTKSYKHVMEISVQNLF